jgi:RNA polymerase sigma-70 factor (ECF subfamily)
MPIEPTQLMLSTKRGDARAFDRLVGHLEEQAQWVAQGLVGSREDARDLAQEAFLRTYRARATFREGERFMPWFQRILRNACYTHLRRRAGVVARSFEAPSGVDVLELTPPEPDASDSPLLALEERERAEVLQAAFAALSERDRRILNLRHHDELPYREIAVRLGIPIGTVMSRLYHARRRLRERLEDELGPAAASPLPPPSPSES